MADWMAPARVNSGVQYTTVRSRSTKSAGKVSVIRSRFFINRFIWSIPQPVYVLAWHHVFACNHIMILPTCNHPTLHIAIRQSVTEHRASAYLYTRVQVLMYDTSRGRR